MLSAGAQVASPGWSRALAPAASLSNSGYEKRNFLLHTEGGDAAGDSPAPPLLKPVCYYLNLGMEAGGSASHVCLNIQLIEVPGEVFNGI